MIDTLTFVLHDVSQQDIDLSPNAINAKRYRNEFNRTLYTKLCEWEGAYIERSRDFIHRDVVENPAADLFISKHVEKVGFVKRKGTHLDKTARTEVYYHAVKGNTRTGSHDYRAKFYISENADAITFELSVPKYIYGHNIAQFVPNVESKRFYNAPWSWYEWRTQVKNLRQRLIEFVFTFFNDLSVTLQLPSVMNFDMSCVEFKRLDLCYNQIFPDNAWVLDFLDCVQQVKWGRVRKNTKVVSSYEHSFAYRHSVDGFYFKIYSKGHEFQKHDFPRLLKETEQFAEDNREGLYPVLKEIFAKHFPQAYKKHGGKVEDLMFQYYRQYAKVHNAERSFCYAFEKHFPFKMAFLLDEAMKVLRYEMSFTSTYLSTLYKREIFRAKCPHWRKLKHSYQKIKQYDLLLSQGSINQAKNFKLRHLLTSKDRQLHDVYDRSLHKKHKFFPLACEKQIKHESAFHDVAGISFGKNFKIQENEAAYFSDEMFELIFKKFREEIEAYQIKEVKPVQSILLTIDEYNKKVDEKCAYYVKTFGRVEFEKLTHTYKRNHGFAKLRKTRLKLFIDKLDEGKGITKVCADMGLSKSSYYSLLRDLEKFNIFKNSMKHKYNYNLLTTNFKHYYDKFSFDRTYHRKLFIDPTLIHFDTFRMAGVALAVPEKRF